MENMDFGPLFAAVILSFIIERALAVFFDITGLEEKTKLNQEWFNRNTPNLFGSSMKGVIAALVAIGICIMAELGAINPLIASYTDSPIPGLFDQVLTGIFIAGGSQGSVKLFQDVLGFSKANRDLLAQTQKKREEAAQARAEEERLEAEVSALERKVRSEELATESEVVSIEHETAIANAKLRFDEARSARELRLARLQGMLEGSDVAGGTGSSDEQLRPHISDWEDFVKRRTRIRRQVAEARQEYC